MTATQTTAMIAMTMTLDVPAGTEICDGKDNGYNTVVDDDAIGALTWYDDADKDGYGNPIQWLRMQRPQMYKQWR